AATHGESVVIAERLVGAKSNEVGSVEPLLRQVGPALGRGGIPLGAPHTLRAHPHLNRQELAPPYVNTVTENNPKPLFHINAIEWASVLIAHTTTSVGRHGRHEKRTIQVVDAPEDLGFPHAAQVFLIERYITRTARRLVKNKSKSKSKRKNKGKGGRRYKK